MADTPNLTRAAPPSGQMNRPYDPDERARMDREGAELAMKSDHHALAGSAARVGSIEYDDPGAYDVGSGEPPVATRGEPRALGQTSFDLGDPAELDQLRAGGVGPGGAEERARMEAGHFDRSRRAVEADGEGPIRLRDEPSR